MTTNISWTDETWNPVTGCSKVSPGCAHCYIERTPPMRMAGRRFVDGKIPVTLHPDRLERPLRWRKPRRVFVCSMGDLFHEDVPDEFIDGVMTVMARCSEHTFQVLTKRPERMRRWVVDKCRWLEGLAALGGKQATASMMSHIWLGVSAENQAMADERIPILLDTPAAVRFVSCEPLLGPIELVDPVQNWADDYGGEWDYLGHRFEPEHMPELHGGPFCKTCGDAEPAPWHSEGLDWLIVGGESRGSKERALVEKVVIGAAINRKQATFWRPKPEALGWVRDIREQCAAAGTAFYLKQWPIPPHRAGGEAKLDNREWRQIPR